MSDLEVLENLIKEKPTDRQMASIIGILSDTVITAFHALPDSPGNRRARNVLETGFLSAVYQRLRDQMTEKEFFALLLRAAEEKTETDTQ